MALPKGSYPAGGIRRRDPRTSTPGPPGPSPCPVWRVFRGQWIELKSLLYRFCALRPGPADKPAAPRAHPGPLGDSTEVLVPRFQYRGPCEKLPLDYCSPAARSLQLGRIGSGKETGMEAGRRHLHPRPRGRFGRLLSSFLEKLELWLLIVPLLRADNGFGKQCLWAMPCRVGMAAGKPTRKLRIRATALEGERFLCHRPY
jgi:hypothetical protein